MLDPVKLIESLLTVKCSSVLLNASYKRNGLNCHVTELCRMFLHGYSCICVRVCVCRGTLRNYLKGFLESIHHVLLVTTYS